MNLGAPRNATPEVMAALRAEKMRYVEALNQKNRTRFLRLADYIEQHPECLDQARSHVERFLASPGHIRLHWALNEWREVLAESSAAQIAALFREDTEAHRHLRETSPFAGPEIAKLSIA
ncbi:MAG: hypothetical protein ACKVY0_24100 [Prosthecobacter sp.]|uniref:hypothetical protein n=1 Tax=Prosthecobacter sp. TaxID=1965333 RepID=UPI003902D578